MYHNKMLDQQLAISGVRLGDGCSISPYYGNKRAFTLNRKKIDIVSIHFRPQDLSMTYIEIPRNQMEHFHYRLELDEKWSKEGRFVLKTITGHPFWLNGLAANEAYVERCDRLFIDDNRVNFTSENLSGMTQLHFDHVILTEEKLLASDLNILISGETGTGKTHLAKKIHAKSGRKGNFLSVNLSSFSPSLIESELFGHVKGAFTGAIQDKKGALVEAQDGTLFLDEIDSLPMEIQTKLLTFLDNKLVRPVGGSKSQKITARLIFATGRPLDQLIERGEFRKDFYFRLKAGHSVDLPSLRNDVERIREACRWFSLENGISISLRLLEFYETLAWPGNLRQLFGHLSKKRVLSRSTKLDFDKFDEDLLLQSSDLMSLNSSGVGDLLPLNKIKSDYVKKVLLICEGNYAMAARKLRVGEKTVRNLMLS